MSFKSPEAFEPGPTATIIHAYNSDGIALVTLSDDELWEVIRASGANLIGKPNMHPRVLCLNRYIEERKTYISQVEQSLAIEESHASYFWEKQVMGKSSYETVCMEVNTCGDSLSPKVIGKFLDCCDYPELVSFVYYAPTPMLKDLQINNKRSLIKHCFTEPHDCFSRYIIDCKAPVNIPKGKLFIASLYRKDISEIVEQFRMEVCQRYSKHSLNLTKIHTKLKLMINSQQEEYLGCAFYNCNQNFVDSLCNFKIREDMALYQLEDCFDDVLLTTDTPFVFDHDFDPTGYTGVWLTGGTGYIALHITPNKVGHTDNFVQFCAYIHPSMWEFERESLVHVIWPILKLFRPEKAEIHYRISSSVNNENKNVEEKFIRKRLSNLGYTYDEIMAFNDEFFGKTYYHLNIEKR